MTQSKFQQAMWEPHGDGGESERLYGLGVGHVLTAADVQDIQNLIADHNAMCGALPDAHHEGGRDVIRRIGGDELLAKWDTLFDAEVEHGAARALAFINAKMAELEAKV